MVEQRYYDIFVGTYGNAIEWVLFDSEIGTLKKVGGVSGIENPSFLTVNQTGNRLYAASEIENGEVASFEIDYPNKVLTELNRQPTGGSSPCYISLAPNEQWLFTTNYGGGNAAVHPLKDDGAIEPICDLKNYAEGAQVSHPHTIINIPGTEKYLVTDLGLDCLYLYEFNAKSGKLILVNEISAIAGSGPRHIATTNQMVYVVNEFNSRISVYSCHEKSNSLTLEQQVKTIPEHFTGDNFCADIHIAPSGSYLYASNRGHHSVASYKIRQDGTLSPLDYSSTKGEWPRNFAIIPNGNYILAANERTDFIVVMKIEDDGIPRATGHVYTIKSPVCLQVR
ncbi:hypothetical protein CFK37_08835 [Virgibacillus phasianinus]|uniref:6-phosphogluconolactonase n=1 Tax=Virgibacillus phasianinus TaxID=2017483 RepID=A0A220U2B2_9BACI|nr:lactonase family protein [Virgibacillus phasianinus]ASK62259.1 hypothetical protein CFK37_08835 [Virgibacillus phasianinus]